MESANRQVEETKLKLVKGVEYCQEVFSDFQDAPF